MDAKEQQRIFTRIRKSSLSLDDKRALVQRVIDGATSAEISKALESGEVSKPTRSRNHAASQDDIYARRRAEIAAGKKAG